MRLTLIAALIMLAGCTSVTPPFARVPYQPFSRKAVVAIALREWRLFGAPVNDPTIEQAARPADAKPERQEGLWQRVGEYWWIGLDGQSAEARWTGKHDSDGGIFAARNDGDYAWSAAFVSYVMRISGAGDRFPYAPDHAHYIDAAVRQVRAHDTHWLIDAMRPDVYAPVPGDLICHGRDEAATLRFADLPAGRYFPAHCDIVVDTSEAGRIDVIGGNVTDAVTMTHVPVTASGMLAAPDGHVLDPDNPWMVVLRVSEAVR